MVISYGKNQISARLRYIEIIKVFKINEIIADIKLIHATYRIFVSGVKPKLLKTGLQVNLKGKSMGSDSSSRFVIQL